MGANDLLRTEGRCWEVMMVDASHVSQSHRPTSKKRDLGQSQPNKEVETPRGFTEKGILFRTESPGGEGNTCMIRTLTTSSHEAS